MSAWKNISTWSRAWAGLLALPAVLCAHAGLDERIARLSSALATEPDNTVWRFELADVRVQHGEWPLALVELDQVDRLAPGKYWTDLLRGEAYLVGELPQAAKRALDQFIAAHPANVRAFTQRARAHRALNDAEASLADYRSAWNSTERPEPDLVQEYSNALTANRQPEQALQVLTAGIEKIGAVPALVLLSLERETAAGHFDAALARIDALQKSAPRPEPWLAKRAALLAQAGRNDQARAAWQALIEHLAALPNLERGSHAMSVLAEQAQAELAALAATAAQGNQVPVKSGSVHEEELGRANEQVAAAPGEGKFWYQRSVLLLLDGEYALAIRDADQAERLAAGKFFTRWVRGQALAGQGQLEAGRKELDGFITAHPDYAPGFAARARVWNKLNQPESALADYRAALRVSVDPDAELTIEIVDALANGGCRDEALQALRTVLAKLGPVPALTRRALELETAAGHFDAALSQLDDLQKSAPRPEPWMAKRAVLLAQAGRHREARAAWQALLTHLSALPNLERGSPAMTALAAQAKRALTELPTFSDLTTPPGPASKS